MLWKGQYIAAGANVVKVLQNACELRTSWVLVLALNTFYTLGSERCPSQARHFPRKFARITHDVARQVYNFETKSSLAETASP
eukprot:4941314-Amphidinium_carterae.2